MIHLAVCDEHYTSMSYVVETMYKTQCPACTEVEIVEAQQREIDKLKQRIEDLTNARN